MSIENIVEYINKTPGNTNPSVVVSMVQSILNNSINQLGYYITWDGEVSNRDRLTMEGLAGDQGNENADFVVNFYKVSDNVLSPNQLINGQFSFSTEDDTVITEEMIVNWKNIIAIQNNVGLLPIVTAYAGEYYYDGISVMIPSNGTYFLHLSDKNNSLLAKTNYIVKANLNNQPPQ